MSILALNLRFGGLARSSDGQGSSGRGSGPASAVRPLAADETLFFIHIPKCAGTSFRDVLKRWFGQDLLHIDAQDSQALARTIARRAAPPRAVTGHFVYGVHEQLAGRPRYVSLVRDPLERFVSLYKHARSNLGHGFHEAASHMDLEAFYDFSLVHPEARRETVGIQCYFLSRARSFEEARTHIDAHFAQIAPVERFPDFVRLCAADLGLEPPNRPPRNLGAEDSRAEAAKAALAGRVARDHREDLSLYHYVRDTFETRLSRSALSEA